MAEAEQFTVFQTGQPIALQDAINSAAGPNILGIIKLNDIISQSLGFVNKFRNATFTVWQRGTSINVGAYAYTADGWMVQSNGATSVVDRITHQTEGNYYALRITGAAGVTSVDIKQRIESYLAAQLSNRMCLFQVVLHNITGADFTPTLTVKYANAQDTWGATTTVLNAVALQPCPDGSHTHLAYAFNAGACFQGLEVELNLGNNFSSNAKAIHFYIPDIRYFPSATSEGLISNPPTVELRNINDETELCQRYLPSFAPAGQIQGSLTVAIGFAASSNVYGIILPFYIPPRIKPTGIIISAVGDFAILNTASVLTDCTNLVFNGSTSASIQMNVTCAAGWVNGQSSLFYGTNAASTTASFILCTGAEL